MCVMTCSKCGKSRDVPNQRYCSSCHAGFQKEWRAKRKKQLKHLIRASLDHAITKYGKEGEAAQGALMLIPPESREAKRIVYADNPGEAMIAWHREREADA
jgi:hypothetical protein